MSAAERVVAAVGDANDPRCWSGIPYFFLKSAREVGFASEAVRLDLDWARWPRRAWAFRRLFCGRWPRGFQYSSEFLAAAEGRVPRELWAEEVVSFSQHFPRAATVRAAGGRITYYIDATFAAITEGRGLDLGLPPDVAASGRKLERLNYELADRVVAMASWTAESLVADCGVPPHKVCTILPGANLDLPPGWTTTTPAGRPGIDRPFVLGFVGKDWKRKGLPLICDVRDRLAAKGWKAIVLAAGDAPPQLTRRHGVEFAGFLDKRDGTAAFVNFLTRCDMGCLFSTREALGISTLEFLRVGVPVAGYAIEGPADTLPADAGFRFTPSEDAEMVAVRLDRYLRDEGEQATFRSNARRHSTHVTWRRCVQEFAQVWASSIN